MAKPSSSSQNEPITDQIVHLNVGGQHFSTSINTLSWVPDTFFTSLISGRMQSVRDSTGAIFIDRDPEVFRAILNFLRTKQVNLRTVSVATLKHEAQYFGLVPLVRRLTLCEELEISSCGSVLFQGFLPPAVMMDNSSETNPKVMSPNSNSKKKNQGTNSPRNCNHAKKSSFDLNKCLKNELNELAKLPKNSIGEPVLDTTRVRMIRSHNNSLVIAYSHHVAVYRDYNTWSFVWASTRQKSAIKHVSINSKIGQSSTDRMLAVSFFDETIALWFVDDIGSATKKGSFSMNSPVDNLFFVGTQMVALSRMGKVGIWHSATQNWQAQDMAPISCYDTAGSSLLLGCTNGCLYYIDMQKFPLRMKDNDLLVTELYRDPDGDCVTAISVFLTPKTSVCGNWIEIAYGTSTGTVRVIVQHPETVGHGPQLFQTYNVHSSAVSKISLTTGHLISVCSEYNHVRSWVVTRFRGMISTQPGTMSLASFKVLTLDSTDETIDKQYNQPGPYGDQDSDQVFVQRLVPNANQIFVRLASTGERICTIQSVDNSAITAFSVHECEGASRIGNRPRRFLFCGSVNGTVQMWDLTTAVDQFNSSRLTPMSQTMIQSSSAQGDVMKPSLAHTVKFPVSAVQGGPTPQELLDIIDDCDICCSSMTSTPCPTRQPSMMNLQQMVSK